MQHSIRMKYYVDERKVKAQMHIPDGSKTVLVNGTLYILVYTGSRWRPHMLMGIQSMV